MTEQTARQEKAQRELHDATTLQWLERVRNELRLNEQLSLDSSATPEQLHRRVSDSSALLVQALPFVAQIEPSTSSQTVPQLTGAGSSTTSPQHQLVIEAENLRQSTEKLAQEHKQAAKANDLMLQAYRLLDLLQNTLEATQSTFPASFQPAKDELDVLNVHEETVRQLQDCQTQLSEFNEQLPIFEQISSSTHQFRNVRDRLDHEVDEEKKRKDHHSKWNAETDQKLSTVVSLFIQILNNSELTFLILIIFRLNSKIWTQWNSQFVTNLLNFNKSKAMLCLICQCCVDCSTQLKQNDKNYVTPLLFLNKKQRLNLCA